MWIDQRGSEVLPRAESLRLLALAAKEGAVGRLAASTKGAPVLRPVNFAFEDGVVVVRIGVGSMARAVPGRLVAFEVDGIEPGPASTEGVAWSVLVRGLATSLDTIGTGTSKVFSSPLPLVPEPGEHVVTIRPDVVTGRRFPVLSPAPSIEDIHHDVPVHGARNPRWRGARSTSVSSGDRRG